MYNFEKLIVWQKSTLLAKSIYKLQIPKEERFGLVPQLRRAANSVPLNIAEGSSSSSQKEFRRYTKIARGSLYETVAILKLLEELHGVEVKRVVGLCDEVGRTLNGLIKYLNLKSSTDN